MRKLKRKSAQRVSMLRSMSQDVIMHGQVVTTIAKAKELRPFVEKIITSARDSGIAARRKASGKIPTAEAVKKLFNDVAPRYKKRPGGYCRIIRLGKRPGDGAEICRVELV